MMGRNITLKGVLRKLFLSYTFYPFLSGALDVRAELGNPLQNDLFNTFNFILFSGTY